MDSTPSLENRVAQLEQEMGHLRHRLAALEGTTARTAPASPIASKPEPTRRTVAATPPPAAPQRAVPTPPRTPPAPPPVPPPLPQPSAIREVLRAFQLLPPKAGSSGEAQLGAWWATRLGALLAVIGIVFFGIYLSAHTTPFVRWLELGLIVAGVSAAGAVFERRALRIGPVVTGAALALTYFAAFAAYAVPAVKIVDAAPIAAALQITAILYIGGRALQRDSRSIALMAVVFGFISAFASLDAGLPGYGALAGLGLSLATAALHRHRGWDGPLLASAILAPLLNLVLARTVWQHPQTAVEQALPFSFIALGFICHLSPLPRLLHGAQAPGTDRRMRMLQSIQTSLHVVAGLVATHAVFGSQAADAWFFVSGITLALVAIGAWRTRPADPIMSLFAVKASALLALGIIAHWDARTRWLALVVEAFVLIAGAHRTRRGSLLVLALGTWAVSLAFYCAEIGELAGRLLSPAGAAVAGYLAGTTVLLSLAQRLFAQDNEREVAWMLSIGVAVPVFAAAWIALSERWFMLAALAVIGAWESVRRWQRSSVPVPAMVVALLAAHVALQLYAETRHGLAWLWGGSLPLVAVTAFGGMSAARRPTGRSVGIALFLLAHAGLAGAMLQSWSINPAVATSLLVTVGMAALGASWRHAALTQAAVLAVWVAGSLGLGHAITGARPAGREEWQILSALILPTLWFVTLRRPPPADSEAAELRTAHGLAAAPGVFLILIPLVNLAPEPTFALLTAVTVLGLAGLARRLDLGAARFVAGTLGMTGAALEIVDPAWTALESAWLALLGSAALGLALASLPLWWNRGRRASSRLWSWVHALAGAALVTAAALDGNAAWAPYGSGLWALGGLAFFGLGLIFRSRTHRITGLTVLALCIGRVFVHDINDAQHRIIAFIVLGILLIWVGFSYQRFRHLIDSDEPDGE